MKLKLNKVPSNSTSDTYYDIMNGYFPGASLSDDPETQKKIDEAIKVIEQIANHLEKNDLVQ